MSVHSPGTVYRCWSSDDDLLYIGVTGRLMGRLENHGYTTSWWGEVARIDVEHFPTRLEARAAERAAIRAEMPRFNVMSKPVAA